MEILKSSVGRKVTDNVFEQNGQSTNERLQISPTYIQSPLLLPIVNKSAAFWDILIMQLFK